jgi:hypothetical protein
VDDILIIHHLTGQNLTKNIWNLEIYTQFLADFSERRLCETGLSRDKINVGAQHVVPLSDFETQNLHLVSDFAEKRNLSGNLGVNRLRCARPGRVDSGIDIVDAFQIDNMLVITGP